ncbi:IclR family transcriptional regulator [Xylophilus sp. GOD-11R]|uniref:IclR family transcriptional regulator n=1 Tax=Xylophilus sp. GOD-11R TaxID=3089814 RepID=UPI00298C4B3B|nr:IclR family transcriptional regulator [Xylophilus sp. GOD-11R]WPB58359.1 IclR family transcriptional regulator [Xylophilus sp. GOD-11R]
MPSSTASQNVRQPDDSIDAGSRTLRRGLQLLDVVLQHRGEGVRVAGLCRACGLQRATVYRLLATLIESGYVVQRDRWRYAPGPRARALLQPPPADDLAARLQPVLARVSAACGEPSFAVVAEGRMSHCIARQLGTQPIQVLVVEVGRRQPLGVGAAGLALLSAMPPAESAAIVAANAQALPRYGGMTPERMDILVAATRERGWSVVGNHVIEGTLGVGVPVLATDGQPVAAISVAAPQDRMPRQRQQLIARRMREALENLLPAGL